MKQSKKASSEVLTVLFVMIQAALPPQALAQTSKLNVRSQVVLERTVEGNVRFFGTNLRATLNLAGNVADIIRRSTLPDPTLLVPKEKSATPAVASIVR